MRNPVPGGTRRAFAWLLAFSAVGCGARSSLAGAAPEPAPCLETGSWVPVAPMPEARNVHALVGLPDGRAAAFGGQDADGPTVRVDLYEPASDTWSPAGDMSRKRAFHSATLLRDGRVLIAGGYTGAPDGSGAGIVDVELFDPAVGSFTPGPPLPAGRYLHDAVRLDDGRVLVAGGYQLDVAVPAAVLYDPETDSWTVLGTPADVAGGYVALGPRPGGAYAAAFGGIYSLDLASGDWSLLEVPTDPAAPYLNVPKLAAVGERYVAADTVGHLVVGGLDGATWSALSAPSGLGGGPSFALALCSSAYVLGVSGYRVSSLDGAVLSTDASDEIGLQLPSGTILADGSLFASGGLEGDGLSAAARAYR